MAKMLIEPGDTVRTTPQYEALYFGKRKQGKVLSYNPVHKVVTFSFNEGKEHMHEGWLIVVEKGEPPTA